MSDTVRRRYEAMARSGDLMPDAAQFALADALDALAEGLRAKPRKTRGGLLGWLRGSAKAEPPRGLYIWGSVGRGKTLLMDLFFEAAPVKAKRRAHFHEFMADVHDRIAAARSAPHLGSISGANTRSKSGGKNGEPIAIVAEALAAEMTLLCFDEFAVYDIADAMILGRLFEKLFARNVVVVATTNVAPDDLYKDGLNRALFLPFIALLKAHMKIFHLDAPRDYRLDAAGSEPRYVSPLGPAADACLDTHFRRLSGGSDGTPRELQNRGRTILVPAAAGSVARFSFDDLCGRPLGAGDYRTVADTFSVLIVADIPILSAARRNEVKRLINLIDTLYDKGVRLIVSAEAEPHLLWQGTDGAETFEFARTASRLIEMRSDSYWEGAGVAAAARALKAGAGASEK